MSLSHGKSIFEYSPKSVGAEDYRKLVERIITD
jgi:cellulose biosynthesis protein BcsQ